MGKTPAEECERLLALLAACGLPTTCDIAPQALYEVALSDKKRGLVGEAIDYNDMVTGKRTEGSIYGTFNLSRRVGQTVGNSFAVFMLGVIGYNGALVDQGLPQAAGTVIGLKAMCVLIPAVFILGSWAAFKFVWNITPEVREKMAAHKAGNN